MTTQILFREGRWIFVRYIDGDKSLGIYRAPADAPTMPDGTIGGSRHFTSEHSWTYRAENALYPFDQRELPSVAA